MTSLFSILLEFAASHAKCAEDKGRVTTEVESDLLRVES
jgi:hypothetical protein